MHKRLNDASTVYYAGVVMQALPLANIDFGRLERLLHQAAEHEAHPAAHALGLVLVGAYGILMIWLMASSLTALRWRRVVRVGAPIAMMAALCVGPATAQAGDDPSGVWLTQAGDARVRVSRCGDELCGTVVWLKDKIDPSTGRPFTDNKNPDPALAKRPMIGLPLFLGMRPAGPGKWSGHIYDADDGKTYVSNISIAGPSTLKVEGCVGSLCGGESWTRWH